MEVNELRGNVDTNKNNVVKIEHWIKTNLEKLREN